MLSTRVSFREKIILVFEIKMHSAKVIEDSLPTHVVDICFRRRVALS